MDKEQCTIINKLVRDNIPGIIAEKGCVVAFKVLKGDKLKRALHDKLLEEAHELADAKTRDEIIEEYADVVTVLEEFRRVYDIPFFTANDVYAKKIRDKGSFSKGVFLESVTTKGEKNYG